MRYRTLGATGTVVSTQCLGTMTFGNETDEEGSFAQLDRFVERGGTFVDTADVYSAGVSEEIVGRWLRARPGARDSLVIATKGRFAMGPGGNDAGLSRVHLTRALEASLRRLGVEAVDLYQAHAWDPLTPLPETLRFFDDAVRAGKIRYAGVSNFTGWQLQKAALLTAHLGLTPIVTLQPQYNLLARDIEFELTDVCHNEGIGILPWSPLGGGWLTGKYRRDTPPTGATRLGENPERGVEAYAGRNADERTWRIVDAVAEVADKRGTSMAAVALAWLADRPAVTSVILGARTVEQLDDNLAAADLRLDAEETRLLDEASAPRVADYPYGAAGVQQRARELPAG
ncbi:aldo/keto reductase [Micromonospora zhanjiangensis]|uniref:Aldo/keto reductase n=1 Tax=Micromonospora zhanjiangensis TaxID=1522057 RepID=A0ABV8KHI1_9ACTN